MLIGVIGIGRLGLCFSLNLNNCGFNVIGFDIRQSYISLLKQKKFTSSEPFVNDFLSSSNIKFTNNIDDVKKAEIIFIMVNTPSLENESFDHSQIDSVLKNIQDYQGIIVISATVMPGYCNSLNRVNIVYNPQFIAQGSIINNQKNPDFILIGSENEKSIEKIKCVYSQLCSRPTFKVMSCLSAEITKLALNCYITSKISFANMIGDICHIIGAESQKVLDAMAGDSRIGKKAFDYGYGYGGPCFPRDNKAFSFFLKHHNIKDFICKATEHENEAHLKRQIDLIGKNIIQNNIEIDGINILIKGITYKKGSDILDGSQQLNLAIELTKNYKVTIEDTEKIINEVSKKFGSIFNYKII